MQTKTLKHYKPRKKITQLDIADRAGVSTATTSFILSGKRLESFSQKTIVKVRKAARELGFVIEQNSRRIARKTVDLPIEFTFVLKQSQEIAARGIALLKNINALGFLLQKIELNDGNIPSEPFQVEVSVPEIGLAGFRIMGASVWIRSLDDSFEMAFERTDTQDGKYEILKKLL